MNKYKKLAYETKMFFKGTFVSKIIMILVIPLCTIFLSQEDFQNAMTLQNTVELTALLFTAGITEGFFKSDFDKNADRKMLYSTGLIFCVVSLTFSMFSLVLIWCIKEFRPYILYAAVYSFISTIRTFIQCNVKIKKLDKLYMIDNVFSAVILLVMIFLCVGCFKGGIKAYYISMIISCLVSVLFLNFSGNMRHDFSVRSVDFKAIKPLLNYSFSLLPVFMFWPTLMLTDQLILKILISEEGNAVFIASYTIPGLILYMTTLFFRSFQTTGGEDLTHEERKKYSIKTFDIYSAVIFTIASVILFLIRILDKLVAPSSAYADTYQFSALLTGAAVMQSLCILIGSIYADTNNNKRLASTSVLTVIMNFFLNILFILLFKAKGAAIGTLVSLTICVVIRTLETQSIAKFKLNWTNIEFNFVILLGMMLVISLKLKYMGIFLLIGMVIIIFRNLKLLKKAYALINLADPKKSIIKDTE